MVKHESIKIKVATIFTVLCALMAFVSVFPQIIFSLYLSNKYNVDTANASTVGIIGGADGPTAIFLSGQISHSFTAIFVLLTILGSLYLVINKYKEKHN
ncbi:sodium ion-translocating decarboxylase subunit beta [Tepidanaerobacter sp. GT38]|uniref:sodium ion-translocating decarboxylase subunit beta n=1 Tax=Tepidanaerobacter sp. GT38 TaxID=2722793 RepID=UPI001F00E92D|nr:sodium ion-translocating decarboxylase subunit beta [Tepidanaerobacter sp. GT38]MCG1013198.1 sodium ion-translocating decarboxylase subunit beta [Tepidanaerobacter sp. GT38]